jgi:hypothetical protein
MPLITPSASEKTILENALGVSTPADQTLFLYVNDITPDDDTVTATLTEMSTLGYASKNLTKTAWVVAQGATGLAATASYATQTWTFTAGGAVTVYGYGVKDSVSGKLLWAERFTNPKAVGSLNDQVIVTPKFTGQRAN